MAAKKKATKREPCPDCGGSGTIVWATEVVTCANCNGTGKVSASKSSAKDRG